MTKFNEYMELLKLKISSHREGYLNTDICEVFISLKKEQWCLAYVLDRSNGIVSDTEKITEEYKRFDTNITFIYR